MQVQKTSFEGLLILQPKIFKDDRGAFQESWNATTFIQLGLPITFVQDNQSVSHKNVLRGLHFQHPPHAQGKLVRVTRGRALDVVVDLRKDSKTFKKHYKIELSDEKANMLWVPAGFAHGFVALENDTVFQYKCDALYNPQTEDCLLWNDLSLGVDWEVENPIISDKDQEGKIFTALKNPF